MIAFLEKLARPVIRFAVKTAGNSVALGIPVGDWALEIWDGYGKQKGEAGVRAELAQIVQDQKEWARQVNLLLQRLAGDQPDGVVQQVSAYLNMVPATIQRSLRRPDDPSGRTVPPNLTIRSASDLQRFIPDRMPRFKPGDRPLPGSDLVLDQFLGMGGFGEVWKATHQDRPLAPPVALKFCTDPTAARSLRKEVELLDRVATKGRHPNIVELKYAHLENEPPCLEYEYVNGGDLTGLVGELHAADKATPEAVARIVGRLAEIVGYAHTLEPPIVHRDLKPANVLVEHTGDGETRFKIADFGIGGVAASREGELAPDTVRSSLSTTAGPSYTPLYASPQQRKGRPASARDDVYALSVIWYQLATGDLTSEAPRGAGWKVRLIGRGMPPQMIALLEQCVEDRDEDRPENALALARGLKDCLQPVNVEVIEPAYRPVSGPRRSASPTEAAVPAEVVAVVEPGDKARVDVVGPAWGLRAAGALGVVFNLLYVIIVIVMSFDPEQRQKLGESGILTNILIFLAGVAMSVIVALAGSRMLQRRQYPFVMIGSLLATFGTCACCWVGLPVGIWAVVVLLRPEVREAFA
jgi:eukaryotic-like serine/threonine-protein kinase